MLRVLAGALCFFCVAWQANAASYRVQAIRDESREIAVIDVFAINNHGQIVGGRYEDDRFVGLLWDHGTAIDIDVLPGSDFAAPLDINDRGQITGNSGTEDGFQAFMWEAGQIRDLGSPQRPAGPSSASSINNLGQVVGSDRTVPEHPAFVWESGTGKVSLTDLPGGSDWKGGPRAINDSGQIVGNGHSAQQLPLAVLWLAGQVMDLGGLPDARTSAAVAINNHGQIVGHSALGDEYAPRGTFWDAGQIIDLGDIEGGHGWSEANAINDRAQIVGTSFRDLNRTVGGAILWEDGVIYDLNDLIDPASGWRLLHAEDINNRGQIVGYGRSPQGNVGAFLLTPVPEPASLYLATALVSLAATFSICSKRGSCRRNGRRALFVARRPLPLAGASG